MSRFTAREPSLGSVRNYLTWNLEHTIPILRDVGRMVEDDEIERADDTYRDVYERLKRQVALERAYLVPALRAKGDWPLCSGRSLDHHEIEEALETIRHALDCGQGRLFWVGYASLTWFLREEKLAQRRVLYDALPAAPSEPAQDRPVARLHSA